VDSRSRLILQLREIERGPGDLWEREIAARAREEIDLANTILDAARERLYWLVVERAGPKPVPIERLITLVEERIATGGAMSCECACRRTLEEIACADNLKAFALREMASERLDGICCRQSRGT
jgi:hypothetical protein